ncbi:Ig-like domain-containing protein [Pseudomonas stutzeri]|nr:Ig-like domain-containing protein [Stutzerimonas stutzeri]
MEVRRRRVGVAAVGGDDTVDYTVTDGSLTDTATLTLTVTPVNDAPLANDDSLAATEDTPVTFRCSGCRRPRRCRCPAGLRH